MKYPKLDLGKIEAIVNRLGGMEGVQRFLSGVVTANFKVWKKVELGNLNNAQEIDDIFSQNKLKMSDWVKDVVNQPNFNLLIFEKEASLVKVFKTDLGLDEIATDDEAIAKAKTLGLSICPEEVGLQLRIQYKNQPKGERLRIVMKPIVGLGGKPHVFEVANDGDGLWLGNDSTNQKQSGHHLYCKYALIFCLKQ